MSKTVHKCAIEASSPAVQKRFNKKFKFFAVQFYGECFAAEETAAKTYYLEGTSKNCYQGTGGASVNYVYHFGSEKGKFDFHFNFIHFIFKFFMQNKNIQLKGK